MLQYILTGLAGIVIGIVALRVWQANAPAAQQQGKGADLPESGEGGALRPAITSKTMLIGAGALVLLAIGIFIFRSTDEDAGSVATMAQASGPAGQELADVDTMIGRLAQRLEANPDDGEGFRMLGWSYVMTGQPEQAIAPYERALELLPDQANVHTGYGEALAAIAGDTVTPKARASFEKAVKLDPGEPRARYFLALWKAQNGKEKAALDEWIALSNEGPAEAPWQADLQRQVTKVSAALGIDVSKRLKNSTPVAAATEPPPLDPDVVRSASQMPAGDRQAMIDGMVEGLAARLAGNPADPDGWIRLMRSRMVLGQDEQAGKDLATARKALVNDLGGLTKLDTAAKELKVPGA